MAPRFSIVIPTRDRPETLRHTLATCLDQDFDDFEIIVSDNGSSRATETLLGEINDPRVRHVRPPRPLAMAANFELGLSHANGEYVLMVGDDDGLMPFALREIDRLIIQTTAKIISWRPGCYTWPDIDLPGQAHYLGLPLCRHVWAADGKQEIRRALSSLSYAVMPRLIINVVVHQDILSLMRAVDGKMFGCRIPDVFSGFVIAYLAGEFAVCTVPMTIAGVSGKSNGIAYGLRYAKNAIARDFEALNIAYSFLPHPWVPDLPLVPIAPLAESFLAAKKKFFPDDDSLTLDRRRILRECVNRLWMNDEAERADAVAMIRATTQDDPDLRDWFDLEFASLPSPVPPPRIRQEKLGFDGDNVHIDASNFNVSNIAQAVDLSSRILGFGSDKIRYDVRTRADERALVEENLLKAQPDRIG